MVSLKWAAAECGNWTGNRWLVELVRSLALFSIGVHDFEH